MKRRLLLSACAIMIVAAGLLPAEAQAQYPWPVEPFFESHDITGVFSEYRDTGSSPHFHNGTDIPFPDGQPVYAITDATVSQILRSGSNAYLRAGNFAYVHIDPSPSLSVGDSVFAQETVVGTILHGQGHVHLNDGHPGNYRNALREEGLTPHEDPWAPEIEDPRFYVQPTRQRLPTSGLAGRVEITFRVAEKGGPPGSRTSRMNNGAYLVGFKVFNRGRDSLAYDPGVSFQFDSKPSDSYVHNVFDRLQSSTSRHVYIPTNEITQASYWDTEAIPEGDYSILLYAEDTEGNRAERFVDVSIIRKDLIPPPVPTLLQAAMDEAMPVFTWTSQAVGDLVGYRLMQADSPSGEFTPAAAEDELPAGATQFQNDESLSEASYFHLTAIDTAGNISGQSDIYGIVPGNEGKQFLIVDGFDRTGGSWGFSRHRFAARHAEAMSGLPYTVSTVANEAVADGAVSLHDYDAVVWALGDESTADEAFSTDEQTRVKAYLRAGGNLFVSGSEIAWDLGSQGGSGDRDFLREYLKAAYNEDDSGSLSAEGAAGSLFDGLAFSYGQSPYGEDYPDVYDPQQGGETALLYGNGKVAGVQYSGTFDTGDVPGRLVLVGFPFETIGGADNRAAVMERVGEFFFPGSTDREAPAGVPARLTVRSNFPNPFSSRTTISFGLPRPAEVTLTVYDVLGRKVAELGDRRYPAGGHTITWHPHETASGTYYYRFRADEQVRTGVMTLLK